MEDGFCLSSVSGLLSVVTTFSLCIKGGLSRLVLGDLECGVFVHLGRKGLARLRDVDHRADSKSEPIKTPLSRANLMRKNLQEKSAQ